MLKIKNKMMNKLEVFSFLEVFEKLKEIKFISSFLYIFILWVKIGLILYLFFMSPYNLILIFLINYFLRFFLKKLLDIYKNFIVLPFTEKIKSFLNQPEKKPKKYFYFFWLVALLNFFRSFTGTEDKPNPFFINFITILCLIPFLLVLKYNYTYSFYALFIIGFNLYTLELYSQNFNKTILTNDFITKDYLLFQENLRKKNIFVRWVGAKSGVFFGSTGAAAGAKGILLASIVGSSATIISNLGEKYYNYQVEKLKMDYAELESIRSHKHEIELKKLQNECEQNMHNATLKNQENIETMKQLLKSWWL